MVHMKIATKEPTATTLTLASNIVRLYECSPFSFVVVVVMFDCGVCCLFGHVWFLMFVNRLAMNHWLCKPGGVLFN